MKTALRDQARRLREEGWSVGHISRHLDVSKSSASRWVKDVDMPTHLRTALNKQWQDKITESLNRRSERCRQKRVEAYEAGYNSCDLTNWMHVAVAMLYAGEGKKAGHVAGIVNTDSRILRLFVLFLVNELHVPAAKIRVRCIYHSNNPHSCEEIRQYWLGTLGLPATSLHKDTMIDPGKSRKKQKHHEFGMCSVEVCDVLLLQRLLGMIDRVHSQHAPVV